MNLCDCQQGTRRHTCMQSVVADGTAKFAVLAAASGTHLSIPIKMLKPAMAKKAFHLAAVISHMGMPAHQEPCIH